MDLNPVYPLSFVWGYYTGYSIRETVPRDWGNTIGYQDTAVVKKYKHQETFKTEGVSYVKVQEK